MLRSVFIGASPAELWDSSLCGGTRLPGNRELYSFISLAVLSHIDTTSEGGWVLSERRVWCQ